jgi:hypothetical protein
VKLSVTGKQPCTKFWPFLQHCFEFLTSSKLLLQIPYLFATLLQKCIAFRNSVANFSLRKTSTTSFP